MSGWTTKKLGEVCEVVLGGTPRTSVDEYWGGSVPWLTPGDMGKIKGLYVAETSRSLTQQGLENGSRLFPENTVVLSTRAPIGYVLINTVPMCTNQGCKTLIPNSTIVPEYLAYNLIGRTIELNELGTGTTFKELATGVLKNIDIPIPPLAEQKRIVAKIDAAFEKIDRLKANAEKNLTNAKELLQSALDEAFKTPKGDKVRLRGVCDVLAGYPFKGNAFSETGIKICGGLIITPTEIKWSECKHWDSSEGLEDYLLAADDIVIALDRPWIADGFKIGMIEESDLPCLLIQRTARLRAKKVIPKYLLYVLRHPAFKEYCTFTGSTVPHISHKDIERYMITCPPLAEQKQIIKHLDFLSEKIKMLEQNYARQIADCAEMRQAILREAFEGRL